MQTIDDQKVIDFLVNGTWDYTITGSINEHPAAEACVNIMHAMIGMRTADILDALNAHRNDILEHGVLAADINEYAAMWIADSVACRITKVPGTVTMYFYKA